MVDAGSVASPRTLRSSRRLRVGVLDLVESRPRPGLYGRLMNANLASIMPQAVAVWCEQAGHAVHFVCYTGYEDLLAEFPDDLDLLFVGAFTNAAHLAYAFSALFRARGAVTVLGGPHARCYPQDAQRYFDYVVGFADKAVVDEVLSECGRHRPLGRCLSAAKHPRELPLLEERWKYVEANLKKAPWIKIVPMIGSLGCPYTCSFCIDSTVDYQPMSFERLREDLRFLVRRVKKPIVGWHDPNFGVRFDDYMEAIEESVPAGRMRHVAESSLSLLSEPHLQRLAKNGFQAILPGIESWYELGNKAKTKKQGLEKVHQVAEHVNLLLRYIPYVQTNFVLGMDCDRGFEPFELSMRFLDLAPGAFPAYSLLSAFGCAAPVNEEYAREGRILPFPFGVLDNNQAMNVRPRNYTWREFYDGVVALTRYSFSWKAIARRCAANKRWIPRVMNFVRAISSEGFGRLRYHTRIREMLDRDPTLLPFLNGETQVVPRFYLDRILASLGPMARHLPPGGLEHDPLACFASASPPRAAVLGGAT
jgi:hypothetical protein